MDIKIKIKPSFKFTIYQIPEGDIERWITTETGARVPIRKGESVEDAIKNRAVERMLSGEKIKPYENFLKDKLKDIPVEHLRNAKIEMHKFPFRKGGRILGDYNNGTGLIRLNQSLPLEEFRKGNVIEHELGHHVWHKSLSAKDRNVWTNSVFDTNESPISSYGGVGIGEDFAESYADYVKG